MPPEQVRCFNDEFYFLGDCNLQAEMRERLAKEKGATFTYSMDYVSQTVSLVDESRLREDQQVRGAHSPDSPDLKASPHPKKTHIIASKISINNVCCLCSTTHWPRDYVGHWVYCATQKPTKYIVSGSA